MRNNQATKNRLIAILVSLNIIITGLAQLDVIASGFLGFSSFGGSLSGSQWTGKSLHQAAKHTADSLEIIQDIAALNSVLDVITPPLPYPNPFSLSRPMQNQTQLGGVIGFKTQRSVQGDIIMHLYDMFGNQIVAHTYTKEDIIYRSERQSNMDKFTELRLNRAIIGYSAPAGVYLYYIYAENQLLGRGKLMIVP